MELFLQEQGFEVENLGVCVPYETLAEACERSRPDLVVVSTVNGHGSIECVEIARRLGQLEHRDSFRLVTGGKLVMDRKASEECAENLRAEGFDGVFREPNGLNDLLRSIEGWFGTELRSEPESAVDTRSERTA